MIIFWLRIVELIQSPLIRIEISTYGIIFLVNNILVNIEEAVVNATVVGSIWSIEAKRGIEFRHLTSNGKQKSLNNQIPSAYSSLCGIQRGPEITNKKIYLKTKNILKNGSFNTLIAPKEDLTHSFKVSLSFKETLHNLKYIKNLINYIHIHTC